MTTELQLQKLKAINESLKTYTNLLGTHITK